MKFIRFLAWVFVIYFLLFILSLGVFILQPSGPPSSEFDGLLLVLWFFPFYWSFDFIDGLVGRDYSPWLFFSVSSIFFFLLTLGILKIKLVKVILLTGGVIGFLLLVSFISSIETNGTKPAKINEEEFLLGKEAALNGDYDLCATKPSFKEHCLKTAAVFSGDSNFCNYIEDSDYCLDDMKTANNFVDLKCEDGLARGECLNNYCFLESSEKYSWRINLCMKNNAQTSDDRKWCEGIYGKTNEYEKNLCLENFKNNGDPYFVIDTDDKAIER